jgi:CRP-like cAMP-binding protein
MKPREFLGTIPFFAEVLDASELDSLAAGARRVDFDRGEILIREDERGESMFALIGGEVEVSIRDARKARHVATLYPGQLVGEMSLLTGARRSATVTAIAPVVALEIGKTALKPIVIANHDLYDKFAGMVARRQAELDRLYGSGFFSLFSSPREQLSGAIRSFFSGTI